MDIHTINNIDFFRGGNATLTVKNNKGEHYTYKIRKGHQPDAPFFCALLGGSNIHRYTYIGIYNPSKLLVFPSLKHGWTFDSIPVKVINWAITYINSGKELPAGYDIHHEGRCCRCGRELTDPESVNLGIGPHCRKEFS